MTKPLMVYHAPYPMDPDATTASRVRPWRMLQAFHETHDVHEIVGYPGDRRRAFAVLQKRVAAGERPEFIYSESSTQPNLLATTVKAGPDPLIEPRLFFWARKHNIPVGQFYRDIYWKFPEQLTNVHPVRRTIMKALYEFDLRVLDKAGVFLFVPTEKMAEMLPAFKGRTAPLPPGTTPVESATPDDVSLFYVGGIGPHYQMHKLFEAVDRVDGVRLTACFLPAGWASVRDEYEHYLSDRIRVVHASTNELKPYYDDASAALLFVEPSEYREFAAPMKFYESMSYGKPIITTTGTHAGKVCEEYGVGVALPYDTEALADVLRTWVDDPSTLEAYRERVVDVRQTQRWQDRAARAAHILTSHQSAER